MKNTRLNVSLFFLTTIILLIALPASAAPTPTPFPTVVPEIVKNPVLAYVFDGNVAVGSLNDPYQIGELTNDAQARRVGLFYEVKYRYQELVWSPNGSSLLFVRKGTGNESGKDAILVAQSGKPAVRIIQNVKLDFAPSWTANGNEIIYAVPSETSAQSDSGKPTLQPSYHYTAYAVLLDGSKRRTIGSFAASCFAESAPSEDPADDLLTGEAGPPVRGGVLFLLPSGILHSDNACNRQGLIQSTQNNTELWAIPDVQNVAISPDHKQAAAIRVNQNQTAIFVTIDLATGKMMAFTTQPNVSEIAWTPDSKSLLYSTVDQIDSIQAIDASEQGQAMFPQSWPNVVGRDYEVSLWKIPVTGGNSIKLFSKTGRAIGLIAPGASDVALSFVESSLSLIKVLNNPSSTVDQIQTLVPYIHVGSVPLIPSNGKATFLDYDRSQPALSSTASFTAVFPPRP